jgi:hypothetical protein
MSVLKIGDSGPEVEKMQKALAKLGWPLKGTGYFGNATYIALKEFQSRKGLKADGVYGPETHRAFMSTVGPADTPAGEVVREEIGRPLWLQAGLRLLGTKEKPGAGDNPVIIDWAKDEGGLAERGVRCSRITSSQRLACRERRPSGPLISQASGRRSTSESQRWGPSLQWYVLAAVISLWLWVGIVMGILWAWVAIREML